MRPLRSVVLSSLLVAATALTARAQKFRPDDPLGADPDERPVAKPHAVKISSKHDGLRYTLSRPPRPGGHAVDVNTLGEVPDSSWFTNRIGAHEMSLDELVQGAGGGLVDPALPWTVIAGKGEGVTPGFTIRDARGDVLFVKLDPAAWPHLGSAADVIGSRFFHAFGYWVPDNFIARVRPEELRLAPDARFKAGGGTRPMTRADLDRVVAFSGREPDGTLRVLASRALPGEPVGPFRYEGTRPDDPNDIFPHEDRRELRGLRVFCAWLDHVDSSAHNTLDTYVGAAGRGHLRHNLIDWNGILGSASDSPREAWEGHEHAVPWGRMLRSALTLGLWEPSWSRVHPVEYPEIGLVDADSFQPESWRSYYPNPAHERMRPDDALWAVRIVMRFTDEAVRAIVHTGEYADAAAEAYLADTVIRRRDKVVAYYLDGIDPLSDFHVEGDPARLVFRNLGADASLEKDVAYEVAWFAYDNAADRLAPLAGPVTTREASLALPAAASGASAPEFVMVRLRTVAPGRPRWHTAVDVYLRHGREVVGVDREI